MSERVCCACELETKVVPVRFPLLRTTYFLGSRCFGQWALCAISLGSELFNPARRHKAFKIWLDTRRAVA